MNRHVLVLCIGLIFVMCQSTQCDKDVIAPCAAYIQDTVLLSASVENSSPTYHLYDTIWINSDISDNLTPLSSSGIFTANLDQLYLNVQPFSISTSSSLPELQYANIEFNVAVKEGMLQTSAYAGYNFLYKRTTAHNTLKIGFIPGRAGPYIIFCTNNRYYNNGMAAFSRPNDQCTTYWGICSFPETQQNKNYWDVLGVSSLSLSPNYGNIIISKNMRSYFLFNVIP